MCSAFSSVLAKLDDSVEALQSQLDCLRGALEVSDDRLSQSFMDARQHAAMLRDLIRRERPDANWIDRRALDQLIHELQMAATARDQQRRAKLLDLANELDAGRVKHRFDSRTTVLNTLRLEAVNELRTAAALSEQVKDLPGPNAGEWLHWACSLQDAKDSLILMNLRADFDAVQRFAADMEEHYWIPGQPVSEDTTETSEPTVPPAEEAATVSLASASGIPAAPVDTDPDNLSQDVRAELEDTIALLLSSERQSSNPAAVSETPRPAEAAMDWHPPAAPLVSDPSQVHAVAASEVHLSSPPQTPAGPSPEPAVLHPTGRPSIDPSPNPADMKLKELRATLRQGSSARVEAVPIFSELVLPKRQFVAWIVAASIFVLVVIFAISYHFIATTSKKQGRTGATASAKVDGNIRDSDIQKDIERRLVVLNGSSVQVTVQDGVVTLAGRSSSKEGAVKAETLALQASGVKVVRNQIQVQADIPTPPVSGTKSPEQT